MKKVWVGSGLGRALGKIKMLLLQLILNSSLALPPIEANATTTHSQEGVSKSGLIPKATISPQNLSTLSISLILTSNSDNLQEKVKNIGN